MVLPFGMRFFSGIESESEKKKVETLNRYGNAVKRVRQLSVAQYTVFFKSYINSIVGYLGGMVAELLGNKMKLCRG